MRDGWRRNIATDDEPTLLLHASAPVPEQDLRAGVARSRNAAAKAERHALCELTGVAGNQLEHVGLPSGLRCLDRKAMESARSRLC